MIPTPEYAHPQFWLGFTMGVVACGLFLCVAGWLLLSIASGNAEKYLAEHERMEGEG